MAPASIRAKFHCFHIDEPQPKRETHSGQIVKLRPVYGDAPENKSFARATPWGDVTMGISNPDVFGFFIVGQDYYLDFTPATVGSTASDLTSGDLDKPDVFAELDKPLPVLDVTDDDEDEPVRIAKPGDDVAAEVGETELSPVLIASEVSAAVAEKLPDHDEAHIEAAVDGHMAEVAAATDVGQQPVAVDVHQAAVEAATAVGATEEQATAIASAIPVVVAEMSKPTASDEKAAEGVVSPGPDELSKVVTPAGVVQVETSALVNGVKAIVPEAVGTHIAAAVDDHHDAADDGRDAEHANVAATEAAIESGSAVPTAEKIADAIPTVAATLPNFDPAAAKVAQPESD